MHVIVATDGSRASLEAARQFRVIADSREITEVTVLAVVSPYAAAPFANELGPRRATGQTELSYRRDAEAAVDAAITNYVGSVSTGLLAAEQFRRQGHGLLVVLSSVAGERVRKANFVYGSTKAGLDGFAQGLGDALEGSGAKVMVVRPGFVTTKMTAGLPPAPLAATAEES